MVEVVSTVSSVLSTALRSGSQNANFTASSAPVSNTVEGVSSHIRVDNLQNVAILEYVSSRTGEVIHQYPTQSQIDAFKRAQQANEAPVSHQHDEVHVASAPTAPAAPSAPASGGDTTTSVLA